MAYLTVAEVALRWRCSPQHVQRLCARGQLPAFRLGQRGWRIPADAVRAYEEVHSTRARAIPRLGMTESARPQPEAPEAGYTAVLPGVVPWRSSVVDAAPPAAGGSRTAGTGKRRPTAR